MSHPGQYQQAFGQNIGREGLLFTLPSLIPLIIGIE